VGGFLAPRRLVVIARVRDDSRGVVGRRGAPMRFPLCNAASATAELQPTVVAARRPPTGARCLLKGQVSVFSCDKMSDGGLLGGVLEC
jgi:hypothetical protein